MLNCRSILTALVCVGSALAASSDEKAQKAGEEQVLFGDLPTVEAAALHAQTLAEAPANVSVITAADIRHYGYRTLGEALASVRGFYVTNDHTYHYVGVRGISLPGDFNTRFLVMLNGHPLTDNIYNSNGFFGQDFGLDMDLVERIEIIRGPTSALYGSNGMLANINVVTRSPVDGERLRVAAETDSFGERKLAVASSLYLGGGANLLVSGSVFNNIGMSFPLDSLGLPPGSVPAGSGETLNADGERGYHTLANLIWRDWSFTAYFNSRDKQPPVGLGKSLSGDPSQHVVDGRSMAGATYKHQAGPGKIQWQVSYDRYRYRDRYDYPVDGSIQAVGDYNRGDWVDSQLTYELPVARVGPLTMGIQGFWELRNLQYNVVEGTEQDGISRPDRGIALFAQQQWNLSNRWKLYGGLRLDDTKNFHGFVSPRVAAVYQASPVAVYKLVYGRPFRNPSMFEQFYNDGGLSYAAAPPLHPETANTFEASMERQVARDLAFVVNGFHYRIDSVIEAVMLDGGVFQYHNTGGLRSTGVEFELNGKLWNRVEASASTALQSAVGGQPSDRLSNSPRQVSKARMGVPFFRDRLFLAGALQSFSTRKTGEDALLGGFPLVDFTVTARLDRHFDLQAGVRNALDRRYEDPVSLTIDRLPGDGRSIFLKLVWRVWE
ncbi:MAG: TonB-dependent receptor [Acidobacteriia bacterium]|nr:TonB-dependent receptor [Terriglobia bacterium]